MAKMLRVRCNAPNKHINEVDLDDLLREDVVARHALSSMDSVPERIVLRCHECAEGKVIITRDMILDPFR